MNADETWRSLHDAMLETVELRWVTGEVALRVRTGDAGRPYRLVMASAVRRVECSRQMAWGFSAQINEVRCPSPAGGNVACMEIEMQSGDVIRIEAAAFCIRGAD